jgi:hypothetical protein
MRPKQINVFDGLRITTEHLDHLQGAFLTGLQDLREVSGLGRVVRGFEVVADGEGRIIVQPGLAFDLEKNRIISDEPKTLDAAFQESEEALWVTIRYDQQESGEIEGKQTLIWDGCELGLTADEPGPDDLAIAIARLTMGEDGKLVVRGPGEPESVAEAPGAEAADAVPAGESPAGENGTSSAPGGEAQPPVKGGNAGGANGSTPGSNGSAETGTPAPPIPRLVAAQGLTRISNPASPFGSPLSALAIAVRGQAGQPAEEQPDPSLTLATRDIPANFTPVSLSCQVILRISVAGGEGGNGTAPNGYVAAPLQSTSWGEVSLDGETLAQHALSQCSASGQGYPPPGPLLQRSLLAEGVVAQLPLSVWAEAAGTGEAGFAPSTAASAPELAACRYLQLSVRAARADTQGFQLIFTLDWKGGYEEARIHLLETGTVRFQTEALLAWKALGTA